MSVRGSRGLFRDLSYIILDLMVQESVRSSTISLGIQCGNGPGSGRGGAGGSGSGSGGYCDSCSGCYGAGSGCYGCSAGSCGAACGSHDCSDGALGCSCRGVEVVAVMVVVMDVVAIIAELQRSPITIRNSSNPSSRKNLVVQPYKVLLLACAANCTTGTILAIT